MTEATRPKKASWRKFGWISSGLLIVSIAANIAFSAKVFVFDPNHQFRIIYYVNRHIGFLELKEPMNERFKERLLANSSHSKRLGTDGIVYISW